MGKVVGIDASRSRSGGAKTHLLGVLQAVDPRVYGIDEVHLWGEEALLDKLFDYPWLIKHSPSALKKSIFSQIWWQYRRLSTEAHAKGCQVLFNTDAGSVCSFSPSVTISQNMLPFELQERKRYGWSKQRLRLFLLKYMHSRKFKKSDGVIFLTQYAKNIIEEKLGISKKTSVIPHGVGNVFRDIASVESNIECFDKSVQCVYVSSVDVYKHQWHVVRAIKMLRDKGLDISLLLIGGGDGRGQKLLEKELLRSDPNNIFTKQIEFISHTELSKYLFQSDIFIFASSCENMPNILIEGMASALPIACSNKGPMPEVLKDGGEYFDPENPTSIAEAIKKIIEDDVRRKEFSKCSVALSQEYSWERCAKETWTFLREF
ncbi:MAG: glycosyltransferase family 1 protein [Legionellaceae bacterium]|nr:glycosyltransferase family 1 protein [Legionellaceae bacterium]